jgi:hypothetical protein
MKLFVATLALCVSLLFFVQKANAEPIIADAHEVTVALVDIGGKILDSRYLAHAYVLMVLVNDQSVYTYDSLPHYGEDTDLTNKELERISRIILNARQENKNIQIGGFTMRSMFEGSMIPLGLPIKAIRK